MMTLLVAAVSESQVWMVADTRITGGSSDIRHRTHEIKVVPSRSNDGLLGFSGDQYFGRRSIAKAATLPAGKPIIDFLLEAHRRAPSVDFAYAYIDETGPVLARVAGGSITLNQTLFLGVVDAFEHFQRIRHDEELDPTPEAVRAFVCGSRSPDAVPDGLTKAITSMLRLFAERTERDVGGWPVPYFLTRDGAFLCGYGYSVSDPILMKLGPGSTVPHGTAEAGGFGLSLTEIGQGRGMTVYWIQKPGGTLFLRTAEGYDALDFDGRPSEFKTRAYSKTGESVALMFGDEPHGPAQAITVMRDAQGIPSTAIAKHGDSFSLSVLNVATAFHAKATLNLKLDPTTELPGAQLFSEHVILEMSEDKRSVKLALLDNGQVNGKITLTATQFDAVISKFGEARAVMGEEVTRQPPPSNGSRELAVIDPIWRTDPPLHQSLDGIILRLRHLGYGWLTFIVPHSEALALGTWLCNYEKSRE
jgi:hypothetical protein